MGKKDETPTEVEILATALRGAQAITQEALDRMAQDRQQQEE